MSNHGKALAGLVAATFFMAGCGGGGGVSLRPAILSGGGSHSLVMVTDGTLVACGDNTYGQLGDGSTSPALSPVPVVDEDGAGRLSEVTAVSAGQNHSLALRADRSVWAWGSSRFGQLGRELTSEEPTPVPGPVLGPGGVGLLADIVAVDAGEDFCLALRADGTVWAWGRNYHGQLGRGDYLDADTPVQVLGPGGVGVLTGVAAIAAGKYHSLALTTTGTVWAWGDNSEYALGDGTGTTRPTPVQVVGESGVGYLTGIDAIAAGGFHSYAMTTAGTVWSWGYNARGQLGEGSVVGSNSPVRVLGPGGTGTLTGVAAIAAGYHHGLALRTDGTMWGWGSSVYGQLGNGITADGATSFPVQVLGAGGIGFLTDVVAIGRGGEFSLAITVDGSAWAFGRNSYGQCGMGTLDQSTTPVRMLVP